VPTNTNNRICYLDCFSGVSGDMLLGALIHCGLEEDVLRKELEKIGLDGLEFTVSTKSVSAIAACKVDIDSHKRQELRTLPSILKLFECSTLSPSIINRSVEVLTLLAEAEAKVHGIAIDKVHFHEVGALDTIVDVVGVVTGLEKIGVTSVVSSPLPTGHGFVKCDHGLLPLPAPAVCELLQGIPTYGVELKQELITPTGAALIKAFSRDFGPLPPMIIERTGYGAGSRTLDNGQPNLLRCIIGTEERVEESQLVEVIETNLDDVSPEVLSYLSELLFEQGALDVSFTAIQMKKGRPGFTTQVISTPAFAHQLKKTIFSETTAIGLRSRQEKRTTLPREKIIIKSPWGDVAAKQVRTPEGIVIYPEFEACKKIAAKEGIPLQRIYHTIQSFPEN
jgi:uncharacterized protein (TIGR00299 family) protein